MLAEVFDGPPQGILASTRPAQPARIVILIELLDLVIKVLLRLLTIEIDKLFDAILCPDAFATPRPPCLRFRHLTQGKRRIDLLCGWDRVSSCRLAWSVAHEVRDADYALTAHCDIFAACVAE